VASSLAGCTDTPLDPDKWFPFSAQPAQARAEASRALAVCSACPIRAECLELSLRTWDGAGRHGIWGACSTRSAFRCADALRRAA
jgi:Transcription factor WhiB